MKYPSKPESTNWFIILMNKPQLQKSCAALLATLACLGLMSTSQAQSVTTSITNNFDSGASSNAWTYWYDIYAPPYNSVALDWDGTVDNSPGHPGSGSLLFKQVWPGTAAGVNGHGQNQIWGTF